MDMEKPGEKQEISESESHEALEREYAEKLIEVALLSGYKVDEGQNAIILEVSPEDLLPEVRKYFFEGDGADMPDEDFVSKVLKIYRAGESRQEFDNQQKAKDIIDSQDNRDELAKVPAIYKERELTITNQELKEKLEISGIDMTDSRVGVILMYKVPGVDMLNYLLRKVIETMPEEEAQGLSSIESAKMQLESSPNDINISQLFNAAGMACHFEGFDGVWLSSQNRKKILEHLRRNNFVMDPEIIEKIEKTMKVLNNNDFYHNDLTERNVMFELDDKGNIVDVFIIDFEKSSDTENEDFGGDMAIMEDYKFLTRTREQEIQEDVDRRMDSANRFAARLAKAKPEVYASIRDQLSALILDDNHIREKELISEASTVAGDQWQELFISILSELAETDPDTVKNYVDKKKKDPDTPIRYMNLLVRSKL